MLFGMKVCAPMRKRPRDSVKCICLDMASRKQAMVVMIIYNCIVVIAITVGIIITLHVIFIFKGTREKYSVICTYFIYIVS